MAKVTLVDFAGNPIDWTELSRVPNVGESVVMRYEQPRVFRVDAVLHVGGDSSVAGQLTVTEIPPQVVQDPEPRPMPTVISTAKPGRRPVGAVRTRNR